MKHLLFLFLLLTTAVNSVKSQSKLTHSVRFEFLLPRMDKNIQDLDKMREYITIPFNDELRLGYSIGYVGILETKTLIKPSFAASFDITNFGLESDLSLRKYDSNFQLGGVYTTKSDEPTLLIRSGLGASIRTFRGDISREEFNGINSIYELYVFDWASRVSYSAFIDLAVQVFKLNDSLPLFLTAGYSHPFNNIYNDRGFSLKFTRLHFGVQMTFE